MGQAKVLLLGDIDHAHETWKKLADTEGVVEPKSSKREEFIQECEDGKLDGVVACYRTFGSASVTGRWDEELVQALPQSLKMVAHNGAGYDQLDPPALESRGILATHVPTAVDDATADTGVFLLLGALRNFNTSLLALRNNDWRGNPPPALGHDPQGKVLGILGMGGIGRNMAKKCRAFGMSVQYHNRRKLDSAQEDGAKYVSFEELLSTSDVLSINVPLSPKTRHLISTEQIQQMKKGIVIVNTARGAVIDEAALVHALDDGVVGSVGLDVYEEEPKVHEGLVKNPNVLLLPHMGTWTKETQTKMEEWNMNNIRCFLNGKLDEMTIIAEHKELADKMKKQ